MDAIIAGRYQLVSRIGEGGSGALYLATDISLNRQIAIKLHRELHGIGATGRTWFVAEARASAQPTHPNLVTIHDASEHEGRPYIAMEYVEGKTLEAPIRNREPLTLDRKLHYIDQVCRGVAAAHAQGITHRDIKPANVMVTAQE